MEFQERLIAGCMIVVGCVGLHLFASERVSPLGQEKKHFVLTSDAFKEGYEIPMKYTCQAGKPDRSLKPVSPPLKWSREPASTKSFALIVDDPDASAKEPWVHWIAFNIPVYAAKDGLREGIDLTGDKLGIEGVNSWGKVGYGAPCPPRGQHTYRFMVYALDTDLPLTATARKGDLLKAMKGHVLATATLNGTYERKGP